MGSDSTSLPEKPWAESASSVRKLSIPTSCTSQEEYPSAPSDEFLKTFPKIWRSSTMDHNLSLYGFRRFKTTHLVNLRFLEEEIATLDHTIYQAGLRLDLATSAEDRLGLGHSKKDENAAEIAETMNRELVMKLRDLIKQYDDAIAAFSHIMAMETFSLIDDPHQSSLRTDLTPFEIYKTRLVRVDLEARRRQDPFQRSMHTHLRRFRFWQMSRAAKPTLEEGMTTDSIEAARFTRGYGYQNTIRTAEILGRLLCTFFAVLFLIGPVIILSHQSSRSLQLATISVFLTILPSLVSVAMKTSNFETLAVSAAYAAVLSVFVSNAPVANGTSCG